MSCLYPFRRPTGGLYSEEGSLVIGSIGTAWFTGNAAKAGGGAISISGPTDVSIANATFASNTAKFGGAISLDSPTDNRRVYENCVFHDNIATDGGAVHFYGDAGLDYVADSVFRDNYASKSTPTYG